MSNTSPVDSLRKSALMVLRPSNLVKTAEATKLPDATKTALADILALLRAQHWLYYELHWGCSGEDFYQKHLLFERLYGALPGEFDALAEKLMCYFGNGAIPGMEASAAWLARWKEGNDLSRALKSEEALQSLLDSSYKKLKAADGLSLGLDDYIMGLANAHETHVYLLKSM